MCVQDIGVTVLRRPGVVELLEMGRQAEVLGRPGVVELLVMGRLVLEQEARRLWSAQLSGQFVQTVVCAVVVTGYVCPATVPLFLRFR